jgi:putative intracellular protease/amidase
MARVNTTACIVYIDGAEFDGVYIVDGLGIMWDGVYNSEIIRVVQESLRAGKMVAAVGHGVAALCNVTDDRGNFIVAGKQVCCLLKYDGFQDQLFRLCHNACSVRAFLLA